jgi:hypothetical protein
MTINQLLSTVILVAFIVTLVLAVGSYMAYKARESRRPKGDRTGADGAPVFFERVYPTGHTAASTASSATAGAADSDVGATR